MSDQTAGANPGSHGPTIEFRTLGTLDIAGDRGGEVLTHPKRVGLLAYLAVARPYGFHRRDELLALFWPELDTEHARSALSQTLHQLRKALGANIVLTRGADDVGLDTRHFSCDAAVFNRAVDAGRLGEALAAYRGDFLPSFHLAGAPAFVHWVDGERARLRRAAFDASWRLAEREEAAGNAVAAGHWARRAGDIASDDEVAVRHLIELLGRVGDRAGAVHLYEEFAQRLTRELEVEPAPETRALIAAVRRTQTAKLPSATRTMPAEQLGPATHVDERQVVAVTLTRPSRIGLPGIRRLAVAIPVLAVTAAMVIGGMLWTRQSRARWARAKALPEAERLLQQGKPVAAFRLLRRIQTYVQNDPFFKEVWIEATEPVAVRTTPSGAQLSIRDFLDSPSAWEPLGASPLDSVRLPFGSVVLKVSLPGFQTLELIGFTPGRNLAVSLFPAAGAPVDMSRITGGRFRLFGNAPVVLGDYWIDKYEVTNRQFQKFVDRGGYERHDDWTEPLMRSDPPLSWEQAKPLFRDRTGRPGPATWEAGAYPDGEEDYPVAGVSWYEAAAYCASVGKTLPTIYHWYNAAEPWGSADYAHYGAFLSPGPTKVGSPSRIGVNGTYDMAGNVKEWVWNGADKQHRYVLGGGWNEPSYQFWVPDAQRPVDRQATYGIRCAKYDSALPAELSGTVEHRSSDSRPATPVGDATFAVYRDLYRYDPLPLRGRVDSMEESLEHWRVERVSFAAAYGNERVPALLFLPRGKSPPFQTVVFFPGAAFAQRSRAGPNDLEAYWFLFLVRSGRAVVFPIYKGTYERSIGNILLPQLWRDEMIYAAKDLGRTIDYLATRPDIDTSRLAYFGLSAGAVAGPIMTAVESRFKASVLLGGGIFPPFWPAEAEPLNFLPRVKVPTLMINGRDDFQFPLETSQDPMFRLLGTAPADKRHRVFASGHVPAEREEVIKEILDWLDRYLGPVRPLSQ